ncbi:MAG TPA: hypothetical protein VGG72_31645 [Bryobacteraceae bacterium]
MRRRAGYFAIAVLLTILNAAVVVYTTMAIWEGWSGDIWAHGLLAFFAALEATSLANVWVQAVSGLSAPLGGITADARGHGDV